jgi:hypothetical protein
MHRGRPERYKWIYTKIDAKKGYVLKLLSVLDI